MARGIILTLAIGCGLLTDALHTRALDGQKGGPPELTAAQARAALLELMRSGRPLRFEGFSLDRYAKERVKVYRKAPYWGQFKLLLKDREYRYTAGGPRAGFLFKARGAFEWRAGRWVALEPSSRSYGCRLGK